MIIPAPVVSARWLADNLDAVRLADVRWALGEGPKREEFEQGHLPGAVFIDLDTDLSAPPGQRGRHPLPTPEHFAEVRGRLGLVDRPVVAYDDQSGAQAARLWWMLDAIGHEAAVLDGGLQAWTGELEIGPGTPPTPMLVESVPWPADRFVEAGDVLAAIEAGAVLRAGLAALGVDPGTDVVASCGSGVTGCHDLLAARLVGLNEGRLYTGSWSEWSLDDRRPVATGEGG